jgi:hypothetical protein
MYYNYSFFFFLNLSIFQFYPLIYFFNFCLCKTIIITVFYGFQSTNAYQRSSSCSSIIISNLIHYQKKQNLALYIEHCIIYCFYFEFISSAVPTRHGCQPDATSRLNMYIKWFGIMNSGVLRMM